MEVSTNLCSNFTMLDFSSGKSGPVPRSQQRNCLDQRFAEGAAALSRLAKATVKKRATETDGTIILQKPNQTHFY